MDAFYKSICGALVLLFLIVCSVGVKGISIVTNSPELAVREGQTAMLGCTVEGKSPKEKLRWYRVVDGEFVPISRDADIEAGARPATGEYRITGNRRRGEYTLEITSANRRDSGEYRCGYQQGGSNVAPASVELQVVVPPDITSPICQMMPVDDASSSVPGFFKVGDAVRLECTSTEGIPPASLGWKRGRTVLIQDAPGRVSIDRVIQPADIGQEFTCYADSLAWDEPRSCTLIPAATPPRVRIMPDSVSLPVEGGTTFTCAADDDAPPDSSYTWFLNGNEILVNGRGRFEISSDTKSLTMGRIKKSDEGAVLACELNFQGGVLGRAEAAIDVLGVQETSDADTTTAQPATTWTSSVPLSSSRVSSTVSPGDEVTNLPGTDDTTHMSMELIIVSAVAGLAVGALAIILIVYIIKRRRKRKAKRQNRNQPESTPAAGLPMKQQLRAQNGVQVSEDGYTILRKPNVSCSDYETVEHGVLPSAPTLEQGDSDMCWDYEIPYSNNHSKRPPMVVENPVYLEIIE
ncbi:nephrin-like [Patiria miniata]|uniref:Ig-like domain-containing protein n=1 Tax=Patiria miniata TaxID=46514 RepID=A0A914AWN4_PATMI|nr:nephrin-like [Patiria miniata]